ncbi:MAG: hypothetical protein M1829_001490 [Trizodia sp. TS-e1964]|nr:MAG: hypothetical protein M1829_001490 [Trizodia sp. TS-e1964]
MAELQFEFRALVTEEIDEALLLHGSPEGGFSYLPVRTFKWPFDDISQMAVLSWRWDSAHRLIGSRNIFCALRHSKKIGIRYLFIDVVAIDQTLGVEELLQQVSAFTVLYRTITVIVAYDTVDEFFRSTMQRPWILGEVRNFRHNPTRVIYVGHNRQGSS